MRQTLDSRDIFFYCDFHGHSVGRNVFLYGNNQPKPENRNKEKVFPMLFQQNSDMFSFEDSCFAIQKHKETCGRIVMWREFNLIHSYTIEVSFMGPTKGVFAGLHFNQNHLQTAGRQFCLTLADLYREEERVSKIMIELQKRYP